MLNRRHIFALPFALLPAAVQAHSYKLGSLAIGHAWAKPSSDNETEAMMPIANGGTEIDYLIKATSAVCDRVEFRVEKQKFEKLELAVGRPFPMRPKGPHLQMIGLKARVVIEVGDVRPAYQSQSISARTGPRLGWLHLHKGCRQTVAECRPRGVRRAGPVDDDDLEISVGLHQQTIQRARETLWSVGAHQDHGD